MNNFKTNYINKLSLKCNHNEYELYMYDNYQEIIKFNSIISNLNNICIINLPSSTFDKIYNIFNRYKIFIQ